MENIELDVHTHTIASGHAYSSLSEMVAGAKEKDIKFNLLSVYYFLSTIC